MKKFKYLFVSLIALCFVPNVVSANQDVYYKEYKVGDEITVTLDKDGKVKGKFIVIENSKEGTDKNVSDDFEYKATKDYHTLTAIYVGDVGESIYTNKKVTTPYESSIARSKLVTNTTDLGWINYESIRLLKLEDVTSMIGSLSKSAQDDIYNREDGGDGCTTDESGVTSCPSVPAGTIDLTALKKYLPFVFYSKNYWLGEASFIGNTNCDSSENCPVVDHFATIVSTVGYNKASVTSTASLRPVITIHKGFVEGGMVCNCTDCEEEKPAVENKVCPNDKNISIQSCIDGGATEEACIKKLCPGAGKTENPKTSSYLPLLGIVAAGIIASCVYVSTKNKTFFRKVK